MTLDKTIFYYFTYFSLLSVVFPLALGLIKYKAFDVQLKALFFYLTIATIAEGINYFLLSRHHNNLVVNNVFTVIEFSLLTFIYYKIFEKKSIKKFILCFYILLSLLSVYSYVFNLKYNKPDYVISTLESVFFISLAYLFYYNLLVEPNIHNIYNYYFFWINSAFLFYFSAAFFLFLFNGFLVKMDLPHYYFLYSFHLVFNITANLMLTTGLWKVKSK